MRLPLLLLAGCACACRSPAQATEPAERGPARRVVALAPNLAEIVADVGARSRLVGASSYSVLGEGTGIASVGGFSDPSIEQVIALHPDLVVGVPLQREALDSCRRAGLRVLQIECQTVADTLAAYETLGRELGMEGEARLAASRLSERLERLRARSRGGDRPRVLVILGRAGTSFEQVFPVGPGNFTSELLALAGGENVLTEQSPSLSAESVIALAPDVVVEVAMDDPAGGRSGELAPSPVWARLATLPAVEHNRVHAIEDSSLLVPGPRMAEGAERLAALIHAGGTLGSP